jgi:hypothetical protein
LNAQKNWIVIAGSSKDYHSNNMLILHQDIDRKRLIRRTTDGFEKEDIS